MCNTCITFYSFVGGIVGSWGVELYVTHYQKCPKNLPFLPTSDFFKYADCHFPVPMVILESFYKNPSTKPWLLSVFLQYTMLKATAADHISIHV